MPTRLHLFGPHAAPTTAEQPPSAVVQRLLAFLEHGPAAVDFDAELGHALRAEFAAQERYRQQLLARCTALRASMSARAASISAELESPYTRAGEYAAGYRAGRYTEATEAAQAVQTVLNEVTEAIGT